MHVYASYYNFLLKVTMFSHNYMKDDSSKHHLIYEKCKGHFYEKKQVLCKIAVLESAQQQQVWTILSCCVSEMASVLWFNLGHLLLSLRITSESLRKTCFVKG